MLTLQEQLDLLWKSFKEMNMAAEPWKPFAFDDCELKALPLKEDYVLTKAGGYLHDYREVGGVVMNATWEPEEVGAHLFNCEDGRKVAEQLGAWVVPTSSLVAPPLFGCKATVAGRSILMPVWDDTLTPGGKFTFDETPEQRAQAEIERRSRAAVQRSCHPGVETSYNEALARSNEPEQIAKNKAWRESVAYMSDLLNLACQSVGPIESFRAVFPTRERFDQLRVEQVKPQPGDTCGKCKAVVKERPLFVGTFVGCLC